MRRLTLEEFSDCRDAFDEAVARTPEIATFCSSSLWQATAREWLHPTGLDSDETLLIEDGGNWLLLSERKGQRVFYSFEAAWMFGCPLIGDPVACVDLLCTAGRKFLQSPYGFCFGGIRRGSVLHLALQERKEEWRRYEEFPATDCMEIDLSGGFDAWLDRRSKKFRKSIRQIRLPEDLSFIEETEEDAEHLLERILAVQKRTYKWREGTDIFQSGDYLPFYRALLTRLRKSGNLRLLFARQDGGDLAYIFGGLQGTIYRGFQMSYVEKVKELGLGNALQIRNLQARAAEGVTCYDLGMHATYKERWADSRHEYLGVFLVR
ncbi:MAG: GNAT family N-acetyltransferase [Verrucomicrobiota bacterium]